MGKLAKEVMVVALQLPAAERAVLVDGLLHSLDKPDAAIDALWAREAEDRLAAYDRGEIAAVDAATVLAEIKAQLKQ